MKRLPKLRKSPQRQATRKAAQAGTRTSSSPKVSRRGTLSRDSLLQAALEIADREGLSGLTIRKLAAAMKVTPMAVYRHFTSKTEITDGILNLVAGEGNPTKFQHADWREWLRRAMSNERNLLRTHKGVIPLVGTPAGFGPNALELMHDVMRVLLDAGFTEPMAVQAYYVLNSYTIGSAAMVNAARTTGANASPIEAGRWFTEAFARCGQDAAAHMPNLARIVPYMGDFASDAQFLYGLDQIIAGLEKEIKHTRRRA